MPRGQTVPILADMAKTRSDKDVIADLGAEILLTLARNQAVLKKWRQRGIPWKYRGKVEALAAKHNVRLPADFREERRPA